MQIQLSMGFICVLTRVSTVHLFKKLGQILNSFSWSGLVKHLTIYLSDELRRNMVFVSLLWDECSLYVVCRTHVLLLVGVELLNT